MPRGGRRPGAGAPKGNLNALKASHSSPSAIDLLLALMEVSFPAAVAFACAKRWQHLVSRDDLARAYHKALRLRTVDGRRRRAQYLIRRGVAALRAAQHPSPPSPGDAA